MKDKVLKNYNKEMNMLILFNILLFLLIGFGIDYIANYNNLVKLAVMIIVPGLPSLLVTNFIPSDLKEGLVLDEKYAKEPILTLMQKEDVENNIDFNLIKQEYGPYSEDWDEQHDIWYLIYREHEYNPRVTQVNRQYLMTRDIIFIIPPLMVCGLLIWIFVSNINPEIIWWFIIMYAEIKLLKIMSNEFYNRVSRNPLLEETHRLKKKYMQKETYPYKPIILPNSINMWKPN